jgi:hypothetical protein
VAVPMTASSAPSFAVTLKYLAVMILVDMVALTLIGAAILFVWAGLQWLMG